MAWNPTWTVDLVDVLESTYSDQRLKDALRPVLRERDFKSLLGIRIVDKIVERTQDNKGVKKEGDRVVGERSLGTYKKAPSGKTSYKDSLVFQIYKDGQKKVDLTLTGEMLESLNSKSTSSNKLVFFLEGQNNKDKAQGHISGIYGDKGRTQPRDFLGLPNNVLSKIFKETMKDYRSGDLTVLSELATIDGEI